MTFDYTQFLSFMQVAVGMNFGFILLDEYSLLQKLQCGLMDEYDSGKSLLLSEATNACGQTRHEIDREWINHKHRIREIKRLCKARDSYDNNSVFMSTLAVICCLFSGLLLFLIGLMANTSSPIALSATLVISEFEIIAILAVIFMKTTINSEHVFMMLCIAFFLFVLAAITGLLLGGFNKCIHIIPLEWNNYIFPILAWVPYLTIGCYLINLIGIWWNKRSLYKQLKREVESFQRKYNSTQL